MKNVLKTLMMMICITMIFQGCSDDDDSIIGSDYITVTAPATYQFVSRFNANESSVDYTGQVVRNVLIKDLKSLAGTAGTTAATMLDLYTNNDGNGSTASLLNNTAKTLTNSTASTVQTTWADFGNSSNLSGKVPSDDMIGFGQNPDAQLREWFSDVEDNVNDLHTAGGLELNQAVGKGLMGLICYYRATSDYLETTKLSGADNSEAAVKNGVTKTYTNMEHYWDEAFGYFGASRDLTSNSAYTDENLSNKYVASDADGDGSIDYLDENNFDWVYYAGKWDNKCSACTQDNDFSGTIFNAFKLGRALISAEAPLAQIMEQRDIIVNTWEKLVAASVIGYVNSVQGKMSSGDDIKHAWSELRAFAMGLQYNVHSTVDYTTTVNSLGITPPVEADYTTYSATLDDVKTFLQSSLGFATANMSAW